MSSTHLDSYNSPNPINDPNSSQILIHPHILNENTQNNTQNFVDPVLDLGEEPYFKICNLQKNLIVTDFGMYILDKLNPFSLEKYFLFKKKGAEGIWNGNRYFCFRYLDDGDKKFLVDLKNSKYEKGGVILKYEETSFKSDIDTHFLFTKDYLVQINNFNLESRHLDSISIVKNRFNLGDEDGSMSHSLSSFNSSQTSNLNKSSHSEIHLLKDEKTDKSQTITITSENSNLVAVSILGKDIDQQGHIKIINLDNGEIHKIESAHKSNIQCMTFNKQGTLIATCSEKGTLIRIFSTETLEKVKELRRGIGNAEMYSIAFSDDSSMICCYSSSNTVHLFSIGDSLQNKKSVIQSLKFISKYVDSEWSMVNVKNSKLTDHGICWFSPISKTLNGNNSFVQINILTNNEIAMKITFDIEKKQAVSIEEGNIRTILLPIHQTIISKEIEEIRKQHSDCVPFFILPRKISKFKDHQLDVFKQGRVFVKEFLKIGEFAHIIAKRMNLNPNKTVRFYIKDSKEPLDNNLTFRSVEQEYLTVGSLCITLQVKISD